MCSETLAQLQQQQTAHDAVPQAEALSELQAEVLVLGIPIEWPGGRFQVVRGRGWAFRHSPCRFRSARTVAASSRMFAICTVAMRHVVERGQFFSI